MEQETTIPGPESTVGERLEWARKQRHMQRPHLISITMGSDLRSSYTNILKKNLSTSKHYPTLAKALRISLEWLKTGTGKWDAAECSETESAAAADDPQRIDENLLLSCYQTSTEFAQRFVEDAEIQPLELFAMTARLYEEARKLEKCDATESNLRKILYRHYVRAMQNQDK